MSGKTMIYFLNNQDAISITYKAKMLIRRAVCETLAHEGFENSAQISVTFTDNEGIRALNREFRDIDKETDVLSFPLVSFEGTDEPPVDDGENMLGDIVLSLEKAREQAEQFGHSVEREIAFLCIHSTLHLLGYDHMTEDEETEMRAKQREVLSAMGLEIKDK